MKRFSFPIIATQAALCTYLITTWPGLGILNKDTLNHHYIGSKGDAALPQVDIYLKRNQVIFKIDPNQPQAFVAPNDLIQIKIKNTKYTHIQVTGAKQSTSSEQDVMTTLYEGPITPEQEQFLPLSLRIDNSQKDELVQIKLKNIKDNTITEWNQTITLPKKNNR